MIRTSLHRDCMHGRALSGWGLVSVLLLAGCTASKEPTVAFAAAEQSIARADRAWIATIAAQELSEAREKLLAAGQPADLPSP